MTGIIIFIGAFVSQEVNQTQPPLPWIAYFHPMFSLMWGLRILSNQQIKRDILNENCTSFPSTCSEISKLPSNFQWEIMGQLLLVCFISGVVYFFLVLIFEIDPCGFCKWRLWAETRNPGSIPAAENADVAAERNRVQAMPPGSGVRDCEMEINSIGLRV
jgi:hypothetical protein